MATTFCNLSLGSGLEKLDEYLLNQSYITRSSRGFPFSNVVRRSSQLCQNAHRLFFKSYKRRLEDKRLHQRRQDSFKSTAEYSAITHELKKEEDISKATLIWRAIKLPIYSVALVPLTVGSAAAYLQTGVFPAWRYFTILASSVLIVTWLNLSNDVYDFDTGADTNKKESVVNMIRSRTGTLISALSLLALGFFGLTWASVEAGNMRALLLLICAITCGYIYQCPPFRLSYQGLGEPLCFAAFGPFATTAFYLLQSSTSEAKKIPLTGTILSASILVGFTTTLILFCSHFHQVEGDRAVGKFSPMVRLGTKIGSGFVKVAVMVLYSLLLVFGLSNALPLPCILFSALTLPLGKLVVSYVEENHEDKTKIFMAKYYCVRLHASFGAALASGLVAARMLSTNM